MRYIEEFRSQKLVRKIITKIKQIAYRLPSVSLMEVCGTHTHNFYRFGLDQLLPTSIRLISGPGCPVCVSTPEYIDKAIAYARCKDTIIASFGDMLRVPGSFSTLETERANGAQVRLVYSPLEALELANNNPKKKIIFLGVGFETTAPTLALTVVMAKKRGLKNLFFFNSLKLIPPVMQALLEDRRMNIQGFLCPGHVSVIIGSKAYEFIPERYKIPCCIAGFEPLDILEGVHLLLSQIAQKKAKVENQYIRAVKTQGNIAAKRIMSQVFLKTDAFWRGIGKVRLSGLTFKKKFRRFDAEKAFPLPTPKREKEDKLCRCAEVLKGIILPLDCALFKRKCNPTNPQGPCMVSQEGACHAHYRYKK